MKRQRNFLVINGKTYDADSGMMVHGKMAKSPQPNKKVFSDIASPARSSTGPVASPHTPKVPRSDISAKKIHRSLQKGNTLYRGAVKAPKAEPQITKSNSSANYTSRQERIQTILQGQDIQKFNNNTSVAKTPQPTKTNDIKPSIALTNLQAKHSPGVSQHQPVQQKVPSVGQKEQLIAKQMKTAPDSHTPEQKEQHQQQIKPVEQKVNSFFSRQPKLVSALAGALSVLLLVGYITYLNMPTISLRVAASRAGFAATMPAHQPSGYSLNGPVAYSPGQVTINFNSNTNDQTFSITERQTNWDAQALLDNHISKQTDNYLTYQEKGLVVYIYEGKSAWVNGGVWYSIDGTASLSSEQILKLATSM